MIDRATPDLNNPIYQHEHMQYSYLKHRAVRALERIFKNKDEAYWWVNDIKNDNPLKARFWGQVQIELKGFNNRGNWMDNL